MQGGEQRRDRRRARALVAPKTDEHHVGRAGPLRLERNLICIRIVTQRRGMDKLTPAACRARLIAPETILVLPLLLLTTKEHVIVTLPRFPQN